MKKSEYIFDTVEDEYGNINIDSFEKEELIRCKDCKYCRNYWRIVEDTTFKYACELKEESGYPYGQFRVREDDYCSRAERRQND